MERYIEKIIKSVLAKKDSHDMAVIVNGSYLSYKQRTVYVSMNDATSTLNFFIRETVKEDNSIGTIYVTERILEKIDDIRNSRTLGNFTYNAEIPEGLVRVFVDGSLDLLIIEGGLYFIARQFIDPFVRDLNTGEWSKDVVTKRSTSQLFSMDSALQLSSDELRMLVSEFKKVSYTNYFELVFNKVQKRIINRCYKKSQFFNLLHAFIPVLIQYKWIFNPLVDDRNESATLGFANTELAHMAVEKKRLLVVNENLSCYMLTHEEICKAFGLTKFTKFTPEFLYKYVVGFLRPDLENFPTVSRKLYVRTSDAEVSYKYAVKFSEAAYLQVMSELAKQLDTANEEERNEINKRIAILENYINVDALYYEIERNRRSIIQIGGVQFNAKVTTDMLYDILSVGNIHMHNSSVELL